MSSKNEEQQNSNKVVNVEEAKEYMKEHVDPIISELLTDIVVDRPENVLKYMLEWTRKKRENDPEMIKLREQAANAYKLTNDRPVTPPAKKGGRSYSGQPRNLSYVGTLGGGNTSSGSSKDQEGNVDDGDAENKTPPKVLSAAERREAMLRAAERRNNANSYGARNISDEKKKEMALQKKRDVLIGKIRALYQASGKDEPFGLGMAKMETLQMHYRRAQGYSKNAQQQKTRETLAMNALKLN